MNHMETRYTSAEDARRHAILRIPASQIGQDCIRLTTTLEQVQQLADEGFLDMDEAQHDSPTIRELLEWAKPRAPWNIDFEVYVIANSREDRRISIEGIQIGSSSPAHQVEFMEQFAGADELSRNRAWWD